MAISAFQGHAALAQVVYPGKINDVDFLTKVILYPLKKQIELIHSLIRSFRSKALPSNIRNETRDDIVKANINEIWVLTEYQAKQISSCFRNFPLPRGGVSFRTGKSNFGSNRFRGKFKFFKNFRGNPRFRNYSYVRDTVQTNRRSGRRGARRGGRDTGRQTGANSEPKQ